MHPKCRRCAIFFVTLEYLTGATTHPITAQVLRKVVVVYNKNHSFTSLRKHLNHAHLEAYNEYENEIAWKWKVSRST